MSTPIVIKFPSGVVLKAEVPAVPKVGESVVDPTTGTLLRVAEVVHELTPHSITVFLSTE